MKLIMNDKEILKLKETFINKLKETNIRINDNNEELMTLEGQVSDPLDKATMNQARAEIEATVKSLELLASQINAALNKLENDDDYGFCISCPEEIGAGRLNSRPEAVNCIHCATKLETKGRLYAEVA
jgi:DnaK suppressor protein